MVGAPGQYEKFPLTGFATGDLIAFVVNWGRYGSLTAWTGQHASAQPGDAAEIRTTWELAKNVAEESEPQGMWGTTLIGRNVFSRI